MHKVSRIVLVKNLVVTVLEVYMSDEDYLKTQDAVKDMVLYGTANTPSWTPIIKLGGFKKWAQEHAK